MQLLSSIIVYNQASYVYDPSRLSGCEVYVSIASKFLDHFSCYGIDSYNLYNPNKIENLHELADYYLTYIEKIMLEKEQDIYYLFGWSLGGIISLEIASILEKKGCQNVKIFLLDTLVVDEHILSLSDKVDLYKNNSQHRKSMLEEGFEESYVNKVIDNLQTEAKLVVQKISSTLVYSDILLFKAMQIGQKINSEYNKKIYEYSLKLKYNNINKFTANIEQIKVVEMFDSNHWDILLEESTILDNIVKQD